MVWGYLGASFDELKKAKRQSLLESASFPSKVGGSPAWLSPFDKNHTQGLDGVSRLNGDGEKNEKSECQLWPLCGVCSKALRFLLQIYAPGKPASQFHRMIYVFICERCEPAVVRAFRVQLPRENPHFGSEPVGECEAGSEPNRELGEVKEWLLSNSDSLSDVSEQSSEGSSIASLGKDWKDSESELCISSEAGNGSDSCGNSEAFKGDGSSRGATNAATGVEEFVNEEENVNLKIGDLNIEENEGARDGVEDLNSTIKDEADSLLGHFNMVMRLAPRGRSAVLRYCAFGMKDKTCMRVQYGEDECSKYKCDRCSEALILELEILPQLIHYWGCRGLPDFSSIHVWTCSKNCTRRDTKPHNRNGGVAEGSDWGKPKPGNEQAEKGCCGGAYMEEKTLVYNSF